MSISEFTFYLTLGWQHIVSLNALDHQLFIVALVAVYTPQHLKRVLILITAFTIGHSLTLLLSVFDFIRIQGKWVEFLIPCTIFVTSFANLFKVNYKKGNYINYYLALFFGLIHGMGFANAIRMMLAKEQNIGWGLFSFNIGLELGQIFFVTIILFVAWIALRFLKIRQREWVLFLSASVFSLALKMALERIPF